MTLEEIKNNDNIIITVPDYLLDSDEESEPMPLSEESEESEESSDNINEIDYSDILASIDQRLQTLESIEVVDYSDTLQQVCDNTYRLYYFIGGLYVAFAIIIGIKFLRIFF